jgi:hypothetical protein
VSGNIGPGDRPDNARDRLSSSVENAATAAQEETRVMQSVSAIERQTMGKVYLRLLPFCFVLYFICYLA